MSTKALALAAALLASAAVRAEAAATIASGPVFVASNGNYSCSVVNFGPKEIGSVDVLVTIANAAFGSGTKVTCAPLAPAGSCRAVNQAGAAADRFCTVSITNGSKKNVRATFCNTDTQVCVPLQ